MRRKGQAINIDWTIGLGIFLLTSLTTVLFILNAGITGNDVNSLTSKTYDVKSDIEAETSIEGSRIPLMTRGPENISNIPVDRNYNFGPDAWPDSGSGNIPAVLDIEQDRIITITDAGNLTNYLTYFSEEVDPVNYENDISTGNWINNSRISLRPETPGLTSLKVNDKEVLNSNADLGSGTYTIKEEELHASTLSRDLRVYNGSTEMILDGLSENITFDLNDFDTLYWHEDGSTTALDTTGTIKQGSTKGFTIASGFGITFLGDLTATVSKPDSSTVRAEIDADEVRIRLHDSGYETGEERIRYYDDGSVILGAGESFSAPYRSKIRQLNSVSQTEFENTLELDNFNYNIGFGPWIRKQINKLTEWNEGEFNGTSASRKDNSGDLGIGYRNGTAGDSLVGYWRLDRDVSGDGGTVIDYSGENQNVVVDGGASTGLRGVFGTNSTALDSSGSYITQTEAGVSEPIRTVGFWIKNSDQGGSWNTVLRWRVENDAGEQTARTELDGGAERLYTRWITDPSDDASSQNDGGIWSRSDSFSYADGEWHYYASTFDGNTIREYWDGELFSESSGYNSNVAETLSNEPISLNRGGMSPTFDEVQIYTEALSQSEVEKLYRNGRNGNFSGEYVIENQAGSFQQWDELIVNADIPTGTDVEAVFESLDGEGNTIDRQIIDLESGENTYSIDSDSSEGYRITFRGTSNDPTRTWEIKNYNLKYGPELSRGMSLPLDTSTVVLERGSSIVDRNGTFSSIENQVVLWR